MKNIVVVGAQWGDEGKGKIVDWLCKQADIIVRFQGGHNAGHTIIANGKTYKLSLLPSGIVSAGKLNIIGNGVVICPQALFAEIASLQDLGLKISNDNLKISYNANLILPLHRQLDILRENASLDKIGTTKRGIGPAYEDKVGRRGIRIVDLQDKDILRKKIEKLLLHHNAILRGLGEKEIAAQQLFDYLIAVKEKLFAFCADVSTILAKANLANKKILFEGAQGSLLDIDHGTYPFVTSSNVVAPQAAIGSGIGAKNLDFVLGIVKAYTTRVGEGPFPTEQKNEIGDYLTKAGHEFGTVTGRQRRCGWFDCVLVKHAVQINGMDKIALTKLDVLDGLEEIKVCIGYEGGGEFGYFADGAKPIYETLPGWQESIVGIKDICKLPKNAIEYVRFIEKHIGVRAVLLSVSPHRNDTIMLGDIFV